ncbi:MAG: N-acetyl-gamma-glutamyl-phosphate reductase [Gammaproteobacteria bacterium]
MINVGIVGASGYTGLELLRILSAHPEIKISCVTSRSEQGRGVAEIFPALRGRIALQFVVPAEAPLSDCDVVFFATPHGAAMLQVPALLNAGVKVIDLSADFRLQDAAEWEHWYKSPHACPELLQQAVYGLTEINREQIRSAQLIANPGCYATAVQLGFIPLLEQGLVDKTTLVADAKSGVSGAGRNTQPHTQFCETAESFSAYAVDGHRHLPEIMQGLRSAATDSVELVFVPHLLPINRGIEATLYARLSDKQTDLHTLFRERYKDETFIDVMPPGDHPDTASVRGSNLCRIACFTPQSGDTAVISVVEDNLVKGAAGQAIQNMNLMCGIDEASGLLHLPITP